MYYMRENYPSLNDGFVLRRLSTHTDEIFLPASNDTPTEIGLWSVSRSPLDNAQDLSALSPAGNLTVWLLYTNMNQNLTYTFNCSDPDRSLMSPYFGGETVKNLFWPYEEYTLNASTTEFFANGSAPFFGCLDSIEMDAYSFKALVPEIDWIEMYPVVTAFSPGHDARILSENGSTTISIEFKFSQNMSCESVTNGLTINSTTESGDVPTIKSGSVSCLDISPPEPPEYIGALGSSWTWQAQLENVHDGVHQLTLTNITNTASTDSTRVLFLCFNLSDLKATDHFLLRVGRADNPIVFPRSANFSATLLDRHTDGSLFISHQAAGADKFRYSTNFESSYSDWLDYGSGGNFTLTESPWSGTKKQEWPGKHVTVQYWSRLIGSSSHVQHSDIDLPDDYPPYRRWPHAFMMGAFNLFGIDGGINNVMEITKDGEWTYNFMADWPTAVQVNIWGINADGQPDQSFVYGDVDGDQVLDRLPPSSLANNFINVTLGPEAPYLSWQIVISDGLGRYTLLPMGSRHLQLIMFAMLWVIPLITGILAVVIFKGSFYQVLFFTARR